MNGAGDGRPHGAGCPQPLLTSNRKAPIMSKKPASPFSRATTRTIREVRHAVEAYEGWKREYLAGTGSQKAPVPPIFYTTNLGPGGGHPRAYVNAVYEAYNRTVAWYEEHRTAALDDAAALNELKFYDRAAYETLMLRRALEASA